MIVLTMDQRESGASPDLVASWSSRLNDEFAAGLRLPFIRTAGDEMQAVFIDVGALVRVLFMALDDASWWVGVGLGSAEMLGDTARDSRGPAFVSARDAVEAAKRRSWACAVRGDPEWAAQAADGLMAMLTFATATRTARASELMALATDGTPQREIAESLGISRQAVSKQLKRAGLEQVRLGHAALLVVLSQANVMSGVGRARNDF